MLYTKSQEHREVVLEKKIFTIHGHCDHLGHVTRLIYINFHSHSNKIWFRMTQQCFRQTSFNFEICVTFGQGQRMTLTFDTPLTSLRPRSENDIDL